MTTSTPGPTPPEEPPKWEDLIDEWNDTAKANLDRFAARARKNVKRARRGQYGLGALLDDVKWFWEGVAENASALVDSVQVPDETRPRTPGSGRP